MPLYEYECEACLHRFEVIQKFSDAAIEECPVCRGRVRKLLSSPAIQFKGSGWYVTDYARKPAPAEQGKKEGGTKEGGAKEGAKDAGTSESSAKSSESTPAPSSNATSKKDE